MELSDLGWTDRFDSLFEDYRQQGLEPARVAWAARGQVSALCDSDSCTAVVGGVLDRNGEAGPVVVGDWVALDRRGPTAAVRAILPRGNGLARRRAGSDVERQVVAANIDLVVLVEGLDRGPNRARIERGLTIAWDSGATPLVVLTKSDLASDLGAAREVANAAAPFVDVVAVSGLDGSGLDELERCLHAGATAVLLGPSGVGKSTLTNRLCGRDHQRTGAVRGGDRKGRHTTSRHQLFPLPGGALLIDTPGVRELGLWLDAAAVDGAFSDIEQLARGCRFRDCQHDSEPGCAVREAAAAGDLDELRLASYLKLRREAEVLEARSTTQGRLELKARDRSLARLVREVTRDKER